MNTNIITAEYGHVTNVTFKNKFGWEESYFIVKVKKDNDFDLIYYLDNLIDKFNEMPAKDFKLAAIYHKNPLLQKWDANPPISCRNPDI